MLSTLLNYCTIVGVAFIIAAVTTPLAMKTAFRGNILDRPGKHKIHRLAKPLLGGAAIFISIFVTLFLFFEVDNRILTLMAAAVVLVITGLLDDIYGLKPFPKLAGQTIAASIVVLGNLSLYRFMFEYFERLYIPNYVTAILLIGWVVLIINAFNLIDGLDGLAAGTASIIFFSMAIISIITGANPNYLGVQLIGLGACLGFLMYNFNPARIYMGDTGSMLLGFILATVHLFTIKYPFSAQLVLGSMFIFAFPALDITFAIYRRFNKGSSIFKADQGHIHHIFLRLGFSVRKTVLIIYATNIVFTLIAILMLSLHIPTPLLFVTGILTAIFIVILFRWLMIVSKQKSTKRV